MATIETFRAVVFELVVENVTDRKAVWYWATVAVPFKVSTPPETMAAVMPFWVVKCNVSGDCSVLAEIVTTAPLKLASLELTVSPGSIANADAPLPTVYVMLVPDAVTIGTATPTLTLSAAALLLFAPSMATIEIERVVVLLLVVENVTDCKAV
jgi:hypothetical protein